MVCRCRCIHGMQMHVHMQIMCVCACRGYVDANVAMCVDDTHRQMYIQIKAYVHMILIWTDIGDIGMIATEAQTQVKIRNVFISHPRVHLYQCVDGSTVFYSKTSSGFFTQLASQPPLIGSAIPFFFKCLLLFLSVNFSLSPRLGQPMQLLPKCSCEDQCPSDPALCGSCFLIPTLSVSTHLCGFNFLPLMFYHQRLSLPSAVPIWPHPALSSWMTA